MNVWTIVFGPHLGPSAAPGPPQYLPPFSKFPSPISDCSSTYIVMYFFQIWYFQMSADRYIRFFSFFSWAKQVYLIVFSQANQARATPGQWHHPVNRHSGWWWQYGRQRASYHQAWKPGLGNHPPLHRYTSSSLLSLSLDNPRQFCALLAPPWTSLPVSLFMQSPNPVTVLVLTWPCWHPGPLSWPGVVGTLNHCLDLALLAPWTTVLTWPC